MKYTADLHIHTDYDPLRDYWHGDHPSRIAAGIVESGIDVFATTDHNMVSPRFFEVKDEVDRLLEEEVASGITRTKRQVLGLLGVELTVMFEGMTYHLGYVFEENVRPNSLPDLPAVKSNVRDLEHWRIDNPGIAILNHPTLRDVGRPRSLDVTKCFMTSGLVDGIELLNGSVLYNGADIRITAEALRLYKELFLRGAHVQERVSPIGCSDAHVGLGRPGKKNLVGSVVTDFSGSEPGGLFAEVKAGNTRAVAVDEHIRNKVRALLKGSFAGNKELGRKVVTY